MCANSEGSGETAWMCRLVWVFAGRLCDKYHNLMTWLICSNKTFMSLLQNGLDVFIILALQTVHSRLFVFYHFLSISLLLLLDRKGPFFSKGNEVIGKVLSHTRFVHLRKNERVWHYDMQCNAKWATTWQNQQNGCAPSEDSDQPGRRPSLIRVFTVHMKKAWVLSYLLRAQRRLWSDWADAQADLCLR